MTGRYNKKHTKIICLLAVCMLLVFGICADHEQAYAGFSYDFTSNSANCCLRSTVSLTFQAACTTELLGQRPALEEAKITTESCRHRERTCYEAAQFYPTPSPHTSFSLYRVVSREVNHEPLSHTVILKYIHHKDGQKL